MTVSVHFLLRFVVASSLLMGLWLGWGVDYLDLVAPAVNSLTVWLDVPFQLIRDGDAVLYAYHPPVGRSFRLLATGQESIVSVVPWLKSEVSPEITSPQETQETGAQSAADEPTSESSPASSPPEKSESPGPPGYSPSSGQSSAVRTTDRRIKARTWNRLIEASLPRSST